MFVEVLVPWIHNRFKVETQRLVIWVQSEQDELVLIKFKMVMTTYTPGKL